MTSIVTQLNTTQQANQIIARDSQQSITTGELLADCRRLADELITHDIKVLALYGDNSIDWLIVDIACQLASICLVPLPTFFSAEQLQHIVDSVAIDAICCESPEIFRLLLSKRIQHCHPCSVNRFKLVMLSTIKNISTRPDSTGKITFTSGSTGNPKGVCLSNEQLLQQACALSTAVGIEKPRHLCLLPLSTLLENVAGVYTALLAGGEVIIPSLQEIGFEGSSSLNPNSFTQAIYQYNPTSIILTPQLLATLISAANTGWKPPVSLQFVAVGGGRVSSDLLSQAHKLNIPAYEGYGLSECASVVSLNTPNRSVNVGCGKPLPRLQVTIDQGEIVVSGNAMLGYVSEPESWGKTHIRTGDLGSIDNKGNLHIQGRKKNLLISTYGRNINPEWIESELLVHTDITECIVFGDDKPYCIALLSPINPYITDKHIQSLINNTNARLPDYAQIKKWSRLPQPLYTQEKLMTENGRPKRLAVFSYYQHLIDTLYQNDLMEEKL